MSDAKHIEAIATLGRAIEGLTESVRQCQVGIEYYEQQATDLANERDRHQRRLNEIVCTRAALTQENNDD